MTIALSITHAAHLPERVVLMQRLRAMIGRWPGPYFENTEKAPNWKWAETQWTWGARQDASHVLFLQEDQEVPANLHAIVTAMVEAVPNQLIALHSAHPAARSVYQDGRPWYTTADYVVGTGYIWPVNLLKEFLTWRSSALADGAIEHLHEDDLMAVWLLATKRRAWSPVPTVIRHDTSVTSTSGNDDHENRCPHVTWMQVPEKTFLELSSPDFWSRGPVFTGRYYGDGMVRQAQRWVKGWSEADTVRVMEADGHEELRALGYRNLAKSYRAPKYKVMIATPYRGGIHPEHLSSILKLQRTVDIDTMHEVELLDYRQEHEDLVRVRSRFIRVARETNCTHLALVDADNSFDPKALGGMLKTGKDFVQAPYRRRDGNGYTILATPKIRAQGGINPDDIEPDNTVEIHGTGLGLTLLSRRCMDRMVEAYGGKDLDFIDIVNGLGHRTVALFQLLIRDMILMSEDMSFATRWRDLGEKVWMYVGEGSPIDHHDGMTTFRGKITDLGLERGQAA